MYEKINELKSNTMQSKHTNLMTKKQHKIILLGNQIGLD